MWYREGTISITGGSTTVNGSGTYWLASIMPGDSLLIGSYQYEIASVVSNTQLTLVTPYIGSTMSGSSYAIIVISTTNSGLAARITNVATIWQQRELEISAWQAGTISGGPNSDGKYPLTSPDGVQHLIYCPAAMAQFAGGGVEDARIAAEASAAAAHTSEVNAATSATDAAGYAGAAEQSALDAAQFNPALYVQSTDDRLLLLYAAL